MNNNNNTWTVILRFKRIEKKVNNTHQKVAKSSKISRTGTRPPIWKRSVSSFLHQFSAQFGISFRPGFQISVSEWCEVPWKTNKRTFLKKFLKSFQKILCCVVHCDQYSIGISQCHGVDWRVDPCQGLLLLPFIKQEKKKNHVHLSDWFLLIWVMPS